MSLFYTGDLHMGFLLFIYYGMGLFKYVRILVPTNSFFSFNIRKRRVGYDQQFGFQKVCDIYQVFLNSMVYLCLSCISNPHFGQKL